MSEIKTDKLTGGATAGDVTITSEGGSATMQLQQGLLKMWSNSEISGTASILDSFNQSSITDTGTGKMKYGISNNMGNINYAPSGMSISASDGADYASSIMSRASVAWVTGEHEVYFCYSDPANGAFYDVSKSGFHIAGDLA